MSREKQIDEMRKDLVEIFDEEYEKRRIITADFTAIKMQAKGYRKPELISVEERLPKEGVRVLVWLKGDNRHYASIDTDRLSLKKWVRWGHLVTHWMPLPEPPKGE